MAADVAGVRPRAAGQQMARAGMSGQVIAPVATESVAMSQTTPVFTTQTAVAGQLIMGSGGVVYPVNYALPCAAMMPATMTISAAPMQSAPMVTHPPMAMPVQQRR